MKYLAIIFIFCFLLLPVFTQTSTQKKSVAKKPAAKPTPKKSTASSKPKSKTTPAKKAVAKPKTVATPKKVADEKTDFAAAAATDDAEKRITALRKFLDAYPKSDKRTAGAEFIVTAGAEIGNARIQTGDIGGASDAFKQAAHDAPKPVSDQRFTETLIKFPANLYWRGGRSEAFEIAKILEEKCDASVSQLLGIAGFYMSVENGAEAKRVATAVLALNPNSSAAYQTLGLASRIDFQLDDSVVAYARALDLEPDSLTAKRGLAEMKRAAGRPAEAADLYRQILAKDSTNLPAQTGLILSLFDGGKRTDAEAEMARSLEVNSGNVILLAGAAYWYAAHNEAQMAIDTARKAIAADPRFIWSHIALARGYLAEKRPIDAETTLLTARRYGNFPTLEYEIASARAMAGFYREAAEDLTKDFTVKDGVISTKLGGRVSKESADFTELVAMERRASIFAPIAADTPENAAQLRALADFWIKLGSEETGADALAMAADNFVRGDDRMKIHRQLFAAKVLLDRKKALPKVIELAKAAIGNADAALDVPSPASAVMADELYYSRRLAISRNEYIREPDVPRPTLSAILRGRIEDLSGWALFQMENTPESIIRLKRAVSVLPAASAWWRTSTWHLGAALEKDGKGSEALDSYIKSYKGGPPDVVKYTVIASLYKRVNAGTDGLEAKIGPIPVLAAEAVTQNIEPAPTRDTAPAANAADSAPPTPTIPVTVEKSIDKVPKVETAPEPTPVAVKMEPTPGPIPSVEKVSTTPEPSPTKSDITPESSPTPAPEAVKIEPTPLQMPGEPVKTEPKADSIASPTPEEAKVAAVTDNPVKTPDEKPVEIKENTDPKSTASPKDLFPPVIITIPPPDAGTKAVNVAEPKAEPTPGDGTAKEPAESKPANTKPDEKPANEPKNLPGERPRFVDMSAAERPQPCTLTLSEESLTLPNNGGGLAVILGTEDDRDISLATATSNSPKDVEVRLEPVAGIKGRVLFVVRSVSAKPGIYQVTFAVPCGKKDLTIKVR